MSRAVGPKILPMYFLGVDARFAIGPPHWYAKRQARLSISSLENAFMYRTSASNYPKYAVTFSVCSLTLGFFALGLVSLVCAQEEAPKAKKKAEPKAKAAKIE